MANFFKEKGQSNPVSMADMLQLRNIAVRFTDEDQREILQIDDMLFFADDLARDGFTGTRWTDGKVYYAFDANVDSTNRARFVDACKAWSDVANLTFIARTSEANYIHVVSSTQNSSFVGMVEGRQDLNIYNWTWKFIIVHEIGHALGLAHEHQRADRDVYVRINYNNILPGTEHNFIILSTESYAEYDFASIMHYHQYAFSKNNLPTIEAQPGYEGQEPSMGNRNYMTARDAAGMASRYGHRI